jgi:4-amino-4-deoxy-L-arabinose transferase-like glycosyltransferase
MQSVKNHFLKDHQLLFFISALLVFSYFSHLNAYPVRIASDEAIRALVAAEMMISGDYITPTLNGELYINKPPLYNWILILFIKLFQSTGSFALRFPAVAAFFVMGWLVYFFSKPHLGKKNAWIAAIVTVSNGRILIYESMHSMVDSTFATVMLLMFFLLFKYEQQKEYAKLFISCYLLAATGFLLKGFPSVVFVALTLPAWLAVRKSLGLLFSKWNFIGLFLFFVITGSYYFVYFSKTNIQPLDLFKNLLAESTQRTPIKTSFTEFAVHLIEYPFTFFYHYAPWMILALMLLRKDIRSFIMSNSFIFFCTLVFLVNIPVYWMSPKIYPRYIFMLLPLLFIVLVYAYVNVSPATENKKKILDTFFGIAPFLLFGACIAIPFLTITEPVTYRLFKIVILAFSFAAIGYWAWKQPQQRILLFALSLAVLRIGFNWFAVSQRGIAYKQSLADARQIAAITKSNPIFIYAVPYDISESEIGMKNGISYNLSTLTNQIIRFKKDSRDTQSYYLAVRNTVKKIPHQTFFEFENERATDKIQLIKFTPAH